MKTAAPPRPAGPASSHRPSPGATSGCASCADHPIVSQEEQGEQETRKAQQAEKPEHRGIALRVCGAGTASVVEVTDDDIGERETPVLHHGHQAVGGAQLVTLYMAGARTR